MEFEELNQRLDCPDRLHSKAETHRGILVALDPSLINYVPLDQSIRRLKNVPPDCDTIMTARDLVIAFGD